jgi:hypothetical protein
MPCKSAIFGLELKAPLNEGQRGNPFFNLNEKEINCLFDFLPFYGHSFNRSKLIF